MEQCNDFSCFLFSSLCVQTPSLTSLLFSNFFRDSFLGNLVFLMPVATWYLHEDGDTGEKFKDHCPSS